MVAEFMYAANQEVCLTPDTQPTEDQLRFCFHLIFEEVTELFSAKNIIATADAIGDIIYTMLWASNHLGLEPLRPFSSLVGVVAAVTDHLKANNFEVNYFPLITRSTQVCCTYEQNIAKCVSEFMSSSTQVQREEELAKGIRMCVAYALYLGLPITKIFDEIHRSNMTKFVDGYRNNQDKWKGGPSTEKPNLEQFIILPQ